MRIAVTGSVATDHLMTFPGKFTDHLIADKLDRVSLSFLVDGLEIRQGGVAANIAFGMGCLGLRPLLVGAVGQDFASYRAWLDAHGVDTTGVLESKRSHTARFVCTTDEDGNQIASFYPGAMAEARDISITDVAGRAGGVDLVLIGADDPEAMFRHTVGLRREPGYRSPRTRPSSCRGWTREQTRTLVDGAAYLFSNEYELALIEQKTGWDAEEIGKHVDVQVTTLAADGRADHPGGPAPGHGGAPSPACRPSTRPAPVTRSGPGSWPPSPGSFRWSGPASSAAWSRRPPWRRSAPRSTS